MSLKEVKSLEHPTEPGRFEQNVLSALHEPRSGDIARETLK